MKWTSELVHSLAWPAFALVALILLRTALTGALTSRPMKRWKAGPGGIEVEYWDETLREAKREIEIAAKREEILPNTEEQEDLVGTPFHLEMARLAKISPRAAVLESFSRLEELLRRELAELDGQLESHRPLGMRTLARLAQERRLLTVNERGALEDLIPLRNAVAHGQDAELDERRATEFAELAKQLMIAVLLARGKTIAHPDAPAL